MDEIESEVLIVVVERLINDPRVGLAANANPRDRYYLPFETDARDAAVDAVLKTRASRNGLVQPTRT